MTDKFITVEQARETILGSLHTLGPERVTVRDAVGRRLAEGVDAPWDTPAFDNSAMDGYAFRFVDRGLLLKVVGESAAGVPFSGELGDGEAIRIMTGGTVPTGADTVAMREICTAEESNVKIDASQVKETGQHIRERASYMQAGHEVMARGARLQPADIGLLANFGRTVVYVRRAPRVGIVSTGTELVEPDRSCGPGQIHNSNAFMLEALVRHSGGVPVVLPIVPDSEAATRDALRDIGASTDVVLTVGGVSVGDYDFVRQILGELTGGLTFWKVRMKPGKPLAFGSMRDGSVPVIGLPGNPVASFVAFHQFVRPTLDVLQGAAPEEIGPRRLRLRTTTAIGSTPRRREYVPGRLSGGSEACFSPYPNRSSGNVLSMHACDALAIVDEGTSLVEANAFVDVELL